ncbi:hypothetical protein IE53DRAFT_390659 [Violaceomyces palustris]|uniref:Uncharacterized protein n=1 Tax=Violaceomyces palustris TaxID=1673888 RepID=A0ACD0NN23_9BASI|nr:hypothetical protein IE53DRAFT_390659 [Violaceomyces palustris]
MSGDDEPTPHFASPEDEIRHWKSKVAHMQDTLTEAETSLQEFMESSKELESEMDKELNHSNRRIADLQAKNDVLRNEQEEWKTKYQKALAEHNSTLNALQKELSALRESHNLYKNKLRDMEMDNDELENAERMIASSLADMEGKYNKTIERTALLEEELVDKSRLEEENQRLKDELRDLNEELAILRDVVDRKRLANRSETPLETASSISRSSADEMTLADLTIEKKRNTSSHIGQTSAAERPPSRQATASPTARKAINPFRQTHGRATSKEVNLFLSRQTNHHYHQHHLDESPAASTGGGGLTRSGSTRALASRESQQPPSSPSHRAALRSTLRQQQQQQYPSRMTPSTSTGSARIMQDMMLRMKALEGRINSARNISNRVATAEVSSIPRPSSRLSSSIGAGAGAGGGGYNSPVHHHGSSSSTAAAVPHNERTRNSLGSGVGSGRPSFDGKATMMMTNSSIPIPTNGLSKSTNSRRPTSRLSNVGMLERDGGESSLLTPPPPLPATIPSDFQASRSGAIDHHHTTASTSSSSSSRVSNTRNNNTTTNNPRSSSPSSSHYDFIHQDPSEFQPISNKPSLAKSVGGGGDASLARMRRRSSISSTRFVTTTAPSRKRTSNSTQPSILAAASASRAAPTTQVHPATGPPSSWKSGGSSAVRSKN